MRFRGRRDANHTPIVHALRKAGCSVVELHKVGGGVPDLLVGRNRLAYLLEVKTAAGLKGRSGNPETFAKQAEFRLLWRGPEVQVVSTVDEALRAVGAIR